MKKFAILAVVAVVLCASAAFLFFRIHAAAFPAFTDADMLVPAGTEYVVRENIRCFGEDTPSVFRGIVNNESLNRYVSVVDSLFRNGIVADKNARRIALKRLGSGNAAFAAVYEAFPGLTDKAVKALESVCGKTESEAMRQGVEALHNADSSVWMIYTGEWIIIGNDKDFMRDAVAVKENPGQYERYFSPDAQLNVFTGRGVLPGESEWGAFDTDADAAGYSAVGYMAYADSSNYGAFVSQTAMSRNFERYFASHAISAEWLNLSDIGDYLQRTEGVVRKYGESDLLARCFRECDTMFSGNVALLGMRGGGDVLIVGVHSGWRAADALENMLEGGGNFTVNDCVCRTVEVQTSVPGCFGSFFRKASVNCATVFGDALVLASSPDVLREYVDALSKGKLLSGTVWYCSYRETVPSRFSFAKFAYADSLAQSEAAAVPAALFGAKTVASYPVCGVQGEYVSGNIYMSVMCGGKKEPVPVVQARADESPSAKTTVRENSTPKTPAAETAAWKKALKGKERFAPVAVKNHNTGAQEWFVQDDKNFIYLFDGKYSLLWSASVDGAITSDVYQIDRYKNRKLQYLFSTEKSIYLVDRNGKCVAGYPVRLPASCPLGISLFDYDGNRDYRIFAPCSNNKVYLYGADGKRVSGWSVPTCNDGIVSRTVHVRMGQKDYILTAGKNRLYIWDRKGAVRVNCDRKFNLKPVSVVKKGVRSGKDVFVVTDSSGKSVYIDTSGKEVK